LIRKLYGEGIFAGIDLARLQSSWRGGLLVAVTEKRTRAEIDHYVDCLRPFEARAEITRALARQMNIQADGAGTQAGASAEATPQASHTE
jgi:hypothetical protein